jgi:two-component system sensor histidine kinase YesM
MSRFIRLIKKAALEGNIAILEESGIFEKTDLGRSLHQIIEMYSDEAAKLEARLSNESHARLLALQSQINPHFLYNTLDCIRGQALIDEAGEIANMLEVLSEFFRYSISGGDNIVTLREELGSVENYMLIQKYRFDERYGYEIIYLSDKNSVLNCYIPKLVLQPLVENAIVHGLEKKGSGTIKITVDWTSSVIIITISDNGCGMDDETLDALRNAIHSNNPPAYVSGIALPNVHKRIRGLFGEPFGLEIYATKDAGCDAEISLPRILEREVLNEVYGEK